MNHKRSAKHAKNVADYEAEIKRLLPQAWAMAKDKVGKIYFRNHELKTTTWDAPDVIPECLMLLWIILYCRFEALYFG